MERDACWGFRRRSQRSCARTVTNLLQITFDAMEFEKQCDAVRQTLSALNDAVSLWSNSRNPKTVAGVRAAAADTRVALAYLRPLVGTEHQQSVYGQLEQERIRILGPVDRG